MTDPKFFINHSSYSIIVLVVANWARVSSQHTRLLMWNSYWHFLNVFSEWLSSYCISLCLIATILQDNNESTVKKESVLVNFIGSIVWTNVHCRCSGRFPSSRQNEQGAWNGLCGRSLSWIASPANSFYHYRVGDWEIKAPVVTMNVHYFMNHFIDAGYCTL